MSKRITHFTDGKNPGDILATADFRLFWTGWGGKPYEGTVHAELAVSGAFQYGNQTCMSFEYSDDRPDDVFDTRYENVTPETFKEFAQKVLRGQIIKSIEIEAL